MANSRAQRRPAASTTTRPSRRAKAAVNYAEDDSDAPIESNEAGNESDLFPLSEDDEPAPPPRRKRQSPSRASRQQPAKRCKTAAPRPARRRRSSDDLSDSDTSDSNTESESDLPLMRHVQQNKPAPKTIKHPSECDGGPQSPPKELKMFKDPNFNPRVHSEGKIPAWNSLPYHVLKNIFSHVGAPLLDERTFEATPNFKSVLSASKVCRSWSEPALTVLWQDPVLVPMERAHLLNQVLQRDPEKTSYNYRHKVQHISIDVNQSAEYTLSGMGKLDLPGLIFHCPRLSTLEICHNKDFAPYRYLDEHLKWSYPPELFSALAENISGMPTELKSWRWSSRLVSRAPNIGGYDFTLLNTVHVTPSFQSLRKLAFVNYQTPDLPKRRPPGFMMPETEKNIADTIALLPNLRHLVFEACGVVNGILLPLLPRTIQHLEITACGELHSDDLASFLLTHGRELRSLALDHNQALSLSWLTVLKEACPKLQHLSCNLAYYNLHGTYKDNEPTFSELLGVNEIPTWPRTLQSLELTQLRKWEAKAAENLFSSLLDSAGDLKDLRVLVVKAILDSISWRDRGGFRDRWMKAFDYVFKRKAAPPVPYLSSMGAHKYYLARMARIERERQEPILVSSDVDILESKFTAKRLYTLRKGAPEGSVILKVPRTNGMKPPTRVEVPESPQRAVEGMGKKRKSNNTQRGLAWLQEAEEQHGANIRHAAPADGDSDDEPIVKSRARRKTRLAAKNETPKRKMEVLIDGRSTVTPGGTRYGGPRASSNEVDTSYHSEGSMSKDQVVQGMCEAVELRIDNLRPTENQYTEADFLDSEPEEDGDWNGEEEE